MVAAHRDDHLRPGARALTSLGAKLLASVVVAGAMLTMTLAIVAAGVLAARRRDGAWTDVAPLIGQSAIYLGGGMVTGVGFGMVVLASTPAIVALFALPIGWTAFASRPGPAPGGQPEKHRPAAGRRALAPTPEGRSRRARHPPTPRRCSAASPFSPCSRRRRPRVRTQ